MTSLTPANHVLITGFPGLLAKALTSHIIEQTPNTVVHLFVDQAHRPKAREFKQTLPRGKRKRLVMLEGKQGAIELGLKGKQVQELANSVDMVFCAQRFESNRRLSNRGLEHLWQLIRLAGTFKSLRRLCLFSSTAVNRDASRIIFEEELSPPVSDGTPSDILRKAEQIVRELMPRLPCTVFRPSTIIGNARTGEPDTFDVGLGRVLSNLIHSPSQVPVLIPQARHMPFNVVPIDFVVSAAWYIACSPTSLGRTFHLTDPNPMKVKDAFSLFADINNRQRPLFYGRVFAGAVKIARNSLFRRLIPHGIVEQARGVVASRYDCSGTLDILANTDIRCPEFESYADHLATWLAQLERESRAAH